MDGTILYLVQCESLCRISVFPSLTGCDRLAQLVDTDTESELEEAPSKAEESQPLGSRVPLMGEEFEASNPSGTKTISSHSSASSDSTTPLSPDHPLTQASSTPTPTRASFYYLAFRKRYRSSYETPSPSPSLTLLVRKRYRGTSELILDTNSVGGELGDEDTEENESSNADDERGRSEVEGPGLEGRKEEAIPEAVREDQVPNTFEIGQSSRSVPEQQGAKRVSASRQPTLTTGVSPLSPVVPSPIASLVATPTATISVDADQFLEGRLEMRSFRRGQNDAQRAALWHAIYDIQRENYDLRRHIVEERHERLELTGHFARMERRHKSGGE
ncbi:hypothetical protein Tco_0222316 [Tanacetum coccineum]